MTASDEPFYEPLTARDAWFLYAERPQTPLDLGTVYVFEGESQLTSSRDTASAFTGFRSTSPTRSGSTIRISTSARTFVARCSPRPATAPPSASS